MSNDILTNLIKFFMIHMRVVILFYFYNSYLNHLHSYSMSFPCVINIIDFYSLITTLYDVVRLFCFEQMFIID